MNVLIAVITAHDGDGLTAGSSNGQTAYGYEFRLLDPDRPFVGALQTRCSGEHHLAGLKRWIRFDDDTIEFGRIGKLVLLNGDLFRIGTGLDSDDSAGLSGINGVLNCGVAWNQSAAGYIRAAHEDDALLLRLYKPRTEQKEKGH